MQTNQPYVDFAGDTPYRTALIAWWNGLESEKGERAQLRRCSGPSDVALVPAFHGLYQELQPLGPLSAERLALVAGLASHVRAHDPSRPFPTQLATRQKGEGPALSELRFRRILAIDDPRALYTNLMRVVRLLGQRANLSDLANSAYWWNERTKRTWAFAYYENEPNDER